MKEKTRWKPDWMNYAVRRVKTQDYCKLYMDCADGIKLLTNGKINETPGQGFNPIVCVDITDKKKGQEEARENIIKFTRIANLQMVL